MTFYLKSPRGVLNLHILEECVNERLLCYKNLKNENFEVSQYQYLVEDSSLDRTGHFILRLLACSNSTFRHDFINSEVKLLEARLNSYDRQDVKQFLKKMLKHSRDNFNKNKNKVLNEPYLVFIKMFSFMVRNDYLKHIFGSEHGQNCEVFMIKVPFHLCLPLVSKREVDLSKGFVQIPCTIWKKNLLGLFRTYLSTVLNIMKDSNNISYALEDIRIRDILELAKNYNCNTPNTSLKKNTSLDLTNIFEESKFFPLCMMNLFKVLEKSNRLGHNERFNFSLYMKDIGMSMSDSLKFWEHMYSKEHSSCSRCTHSWQKDDKRYIYGIRHLYGLEGSRRDYNCKNCTYMQETTLGPRDNGGCPFKQFDDKNLRNILKSVIPTKPDEVEVMMHVRNENPNSACKIFLETIYNLKTDNTLNENFPVDNPVDYYMQLKSRVIKMTKK